MATSTENSSSMSTSNEGKRYALVIGINNYNAVDGASDLPSCVNDAKDMASFFAGQKFHEITVLLGGRDADQPIIEAIHENNVTVDTDTSAGHVRKLLNDLADREYQSKDIVAVYFSGHGSTVDTSQLKGNHVGFVESLVFSDKSRDDLFDVELRQWVQRINQRGTQQVVLVLDSCHSGGMAKDVDAPAKHADGYIAKDSKGLAERVEQIVANRGVIDSASYVAFSASQAHQIAQAGEILSVFTDAFLRAHATFGEAPSYDALFMRTADLMSLQRQTPKIEGSCRFNRLFGDALQLPRVRTFGAYGYRRRAIVHGGALHGIEIGSRWYVTQQTNNNSDRLASYAGCVSVYQQRAVLKFDGEVSCEDAALDAYCTRLAPQRLVEIYSQDTDMMPLINATVTAKYESDENLAKLIVSPEKPYAITAPTSTDWHARLPSPVNDLDILAHNIDELVSFERVWCLDSPSVKWIAHDAIDVKVSKASVARIISDQNGSKLKSATTVTVTNNSDSTVRANAVVLVPHNASICGPYEEFELKKSEQKKFELKTGETRDFKVNFDVFSEESVRVKVFVAESSVELALQGLHQCGYLNDNNKKAMMSKSEEKAACKETPPSWRVFNFEVPVLVPLDYDDVLKNGTNQQRWMCEITDFQKSELDEDHPANFNGYIYTIVKLNDAHYAIFTRTGVDDVVRYVGEPTDKLSFGDSLCDLGEPTDNLSPVASLPTLGDLRNGTATPQALLDWLDAVGSAVTIEDSATTILADMDGSTTSTELVEQACLMLLAVHLKAKEVEVGEDLNATLVALKAAADGDSDGELADLVDAMRDVLIPGDVLQPQQDGAKGLSDNQKGLLPKAWEKLRRTNLRKATTVFKQYASAFGAELEQFPHGERQVGKQRLVMKCFRAGARSDSLPGRGWHDVLIKITVELRDGELVHATFSSSVGAGECVNISDVEICEDVAHIEKLHIAVHSLCSETDQKIASAINMGTNVVSTIVTAIATATTGVAAATASKMASSSAGALAAYIEQRANNKRVFKQEFGLDGLSLVKGMYVVGQRLSSMTFGKLTLVDDHGTPRIDDDANPKFPLTYFVFEIAPHQ